MNNQPMDDEATFDLIGLLKAYGRIALIISLSLAGIVAVAGWVYLNWGQPVRRSSVLEFRPTFTGATTGKYPNGLAFAPSDVAAAPIVDLVYDGNAISEYCPREVFRGGFFVEKRSDASAFLDSEYQGRLSDTKITPVERQRLQEEFEAKRAALPVQFRLVFVKPRQCPAIPQVVVEKVMTDVLSTWASESESRRGVLNQQIEVLTPGSLEVGVSEEGSRLLRADLLRTAVWRVIDNIAAVNEIPGAALVRSGPGRTTFTEVRNKLMDLVRSRLEPLVVAAGQSLVRESTLWVTETVAAAEREQHAAEGRATAYLVALREYSGAAQPAQTGRGGALAASQPSDVQTISPQIDRTFIDRIIEMSAANSTFRQQLTQQMVTASVEGILARDRASYYSRLLQSLRSPGGTSYAPAEVDARLTAIADQAKALTKEFNDLYIEFSRVSLRAAPSMYQTEKPVTSVTLREFTSRALLVLVLGTFLSVLAVVLGLGMLRDKLAGPRVP